MTDIQTITGPAPSHSLRNHAPALDGQAERADNDSGAAAVLAKGIIRARHRRSTFLPSNLFSDPAWDILLELYAAEIAQRRMTVGKICTAARIPATTGLRWLGTLEENGLVWRRADPLDARRFFVSLTDAGRDAMSGYLRTMKDVLLAA